MDDDVSVTDTFSRMLRLEGYEVWAALSADEGLSLAQTHRPHAVILDLRMPLTSGLQFLRAIRAIPDLSNTPVAIVTGDYYLDDAQSQRDQGARRRAALSSRCGSKSSSRLPASCSTSLSRISDRPAQDSGDCSKP